MRYLLFMVVCMLIVFSCRKGVATLTSPDVMDRSGPEGALTVHQARQSDMPVPGATVMVADCGTYTTDERGQVALPASCNGRVTDIFSDGNIRPRRVHYVPGMVDYLLPDDEQMPAQWLHTAFYQEDGKHMQLNRPHEGLVSVELAPELLNDALFVHSARKAVNYINRAQPHVDYFIVESGGSVKMELAPDDPIFSQERFEDAWAVISGEFENGYTVRSRVAWKFITRPEHHNVDSQTLWQAVAHELGHHTGIWGHPVGGIMNEYTIPGVEDFNVREKAALHYLFLRSVGTQKPDDSTWRPAGLHTLRVQQTGTAIIGCGHAR